MIFDVDNTLVCYEASADIAIKTLLERHNIDCNRDVQDLFRDTCNKLWTAFDLHKLNLEHMQKDYHKIYKVYGSKRFEVFKEKLDNAVLNQLDNKKLTEEYDDIFNNTHVFENHAEEILKQCSKTHIIAAATNGLSDIQRSRLKPIEQYLSYIFISEEMGFVKPMKEFYRHMLIDMGLHEKDCLFIGDLYSTDILGALNVNMDACWYRAPGRDSAKWLEATQESVTHTLVIDSLDKLLEYI